MVGRPVAGARDGRTEMAVNPLFWYLIRGVVRPVMVGRPMVLGVSGHPKKRRSSGGSGSTRDANFRIRFWAEIGDFGVKVDEISWMKDGETWGNARSTRNQANPWIKINKTSSNQQITKINWG